MVLSLCRGNRGAGGSGGGAQHGLANAEEVLFSGGSAGGLAVFHHADRLAAKFAATTKFRWGPCSPSTTLVLPKFRWGPCSPSTTLVLP